MRGTLNTSNITVLDMCKVYVPRQSIVYSTVNTSYNTGLDMCKVCTEAVDCVACGTNEEKRKNAAPVFGP